MGIIMAPMNVDEYLWTSMNIYEYPWISMNIFEYYMWTYIYIYIHVNIYIYMNIYEYLWIPMNIYDINEWLHSDNYWEHSWIQLGTPCFTYKCRPQWLWEFRSRALLNQILRSPKAIVDAHPKLRRSNQGRTERWEKRHFTTGKSCERQMHGAKTLRTPYLGSLKCFYTHL